MKEKRKVGEELNFIVELTHVLFDALEKTYHKGASNAKDSFVSHFYKGVMTDYIKVCF